MEISWSELTLDDAAERFNVAVQRQYGYEDFPITGRCHRGTSLVIERQAPFGVIIEWHRHGDGSWAGSRPCPLCDASIHGIAGSVVVLLDEGRIRPLFALLDVPSNNHGCVGNRVVVHAISQHFGVIIHASACSSCWQLGHDGIPVFPAGTIVRLPNEAGWQDASRLVGHSHNELVDDRDHPRPDSTMVPPSDLIPLSDLFVPLFAALKGFVNKEDGSMRAIKAWARENLNL